MFVMFCVRHFELYHVYHPFDFIHIEPRITKCLLMDIDTLSANTLQILLSTLLQGKKGNALLSAK
jgi:hypothetical protein